MERAGFEKVEFAGMTGFRTSQYTVGGLFRAAKRGTLRSSIYPRDGVDEIVLEKGRTPGC
jgi:hypothetical protein